MSGTERLARWMLEQDRFICAHEIPPEIGSSSTFVWLRRCKRITQEAHQVTVRLSRDTRTVWAVRVTGIAPAPRSRPVVGICCHSGIVTEFDSVRQADTIGGFDMCDIKRALNGEKPTPRLSQGYLWFDRAEVFGLHSEN